MSHQNTSSSNGNQSQPNICGLVNISSSSRNKKRKGKVPIPLTSVDVIARVVHGVAQVKVTQVYVNNEKQPIEAVYYYPVNPDGAVIHFRAEVDGRVIKGSVKPSDEAEDIYFEAVGNQKTAFLGEETKADIFKVRVGFLKPGAEAKVILGYVTEVKNEPGSNAIRFYIPTTIAPLYVSHKEIAGKKVRDIKGMTFSEKSPAPLKIQVAVLLQGGITSVESPTHGVKVGEIGKVVGNPTWEQTLVELSTVTTDMDRDFVVIIKPKESHQPRLYLEKLGNGSTAMMVHFVPSFRLGQQKSELIFVLDRSGSMEGQNMNLAKKALELFLHSMPADCYFNVIGFGSTYEFLFPMSVKNSKPSLEAAINHAKNLRADLNGTDILEALQQIYKKPGIEGYLRQIFVLTDGEVSNTDALIGVVQANAHKARVFALGIGDDASHYLVEGLAKVGRGVASFVTTDEGIESKILKQLKNALQPSLTDIEVVWDGVTNVEGIKQSPKRIPPAYDGSQLLVFGLFQDEIPTAVTIKAKSPDRTIPVVRIDFTSGPNDLGCRGMLHRLAAIKLVRELEFEVAALQFQEGGCRTTRKNSRIAHQEEDILKRIILDLACKNGITSRYTSFVAVDVNDDVTVSFSENWVMRTRNVPSQLVKVSQERQRPTAHARKSTSRGLADLQLVRTKARPLQDRARYSSLAARKSAPVRKSTPRGSADLQFVSTKARSLQDRARLASLIGCRKGAPRVRGVPRCSAPASKKDKKIKEWSQNYADDSDDTMGTWRFGGGIGPMKPGNRAAKKSLGGRSKKRPNVAQRRNDADGYARAITQMMNKAVRKSAPPCVIASSDSSDDDYDDDVVIISGGPGITKSGKVAQKTERIPRKTEDTLIIISSGSDSDPSIADPNSEESSSEGMEVDGEELVGNPRQELIGLQCFDGVYELSKKLANIVGKTFGAIREGATKFKLSEDVFATAVAISYFEIQLAGESDIWELVVDKARTWLATKLQKNGIETVLQQAAKFLRE